MICTSKIGGCTKLLVREVLVEEQRRGGLLNVYGTLIGMSTRHRLSVCTIQFGNGYVQRSLSRIHHQIKTSSLAFENQRRVVMDINRFFGAEPLYCSPNDNE